MAKRVRFQSNPARAEPHAAGTTVFLMQPLVHDPLGAIAFALPVYWTFHYSAACRGAAELMEHHETVLRIVPDAAGFRSITDEPLLQAVYDAGNLMISNSVRAVQHLAEAIERQSGQQLLGLTLLDRINEAAGRFSSRSYNSDNDYQGLLEINGIRDALEHPKQSTTYCTDGRTWDQVPLAWMLSERSLAAWRRFDRWFGRLTADWQEDLLQDASPVQIHVDRGIESISPVKKAPR